MAIKSETFIQGKTVQQVQDPDNATLDEGTGAILYDPASFNSYVNASPATTEVGERLTMEPFDLVFELPGSVAKSGSRTLLWTLPYKCRLLDAVVLATESNAGGTILLSNGANAITDAMIVAVDTTIVRVGTIDVTYHEIAAAGTLEATTAATGANQTACVLRVTLARVV